MHRMVATLAFAALVATGCGAAAQGWPSWADDAFERGWGRERQRERAFDGPERARPQAEPRQRVSGGDVRNGGPRPEIAPQAPPIVAFAADFPAHSIVIDSGGRKLYYVLPDHRAYRYAISVGREGFGWSGTETISRKQAWPDWYPPPEMRERDPRLPEKMTGGLKNPLGAMALYLGQTLYRIHGTNDVKSIGRAESSGCFRMLNSAVLHLASLADIGTTVNVVAALPRGQPASSAAAAPPRTREQDRAPPPTSSPLPAEPATPPQVPPQQPQRAPADVAQAPTRLPPPRNETPVGEPIPAAPMARSREDLQVAPAAAPDYHALRDFVLGGQ
jgi:lipoprotein-anchoring transpeptidase ErfK/SrfK